MATKFVYSEQEVQEVTQKYQAGVSLEVLAAEYNKSVASVRMKLVKLGVYVAKGKAASKTDALISAVSPTKPVVKKANPGTKAAKAELVALHSELYNKFGPAPF